MNKRKSNVARKKEINDLIKEKEGVIKTHQKNWAELMKKDRWWNKNNLRERRG